MIGWLDIFIRLGAATVIGGAVGLNLLAVADDPQADVSRVIQGVITGIGFLGAGVILHRPTEGKVHGLTTAATIWVTACLGMLCGLAAWKTVTVAILLAAVLLRLALVLAALRVALLVGRFAVGLVLARLLLRVLLRVAAFAPLLRLLSGESNA